MWELSRKDLDLIIPKNQLHILGGRSGVGKTHFTHQFVDANRKGLGNILYVSTDRILEKSLAFFRDSGIKPWPVVSLVDETCKELGDRSQYKTRMYRIQTTLEHHLKVFNQVDAMVFDQSDLDTLIIDVAGHVVPCKNINHPNSVARGLNLMAGWALWHQIRVMLLWHPNKTPKDVLNDPFDMIAGAHGLQGFSSTKAILFNDEEGLYNLWVRGAGRSFKEKHLKLAQKDSGWFEVYDKNKTVYHAYKFLTDDPMPIEYFRSMCPGIGNRTLERDFKLMSEQGLAEQVKRGVWRKKKPS